MVGQYSTWASLSSIEFGKMRNNLRLVHSELKLIESWPFINEKRPSGSSSSAFQSEMSPKLVRNIWARRVALAIHFLNSVLQPLTGSEKALTSWRRKTRDRLCTRQETVLWIGRVAEG